MIFFFYHLKTSHSVALRKIYVAVAEALFGFIYYKFVLQLLWPFCLVWLTAVAAALLPELSELHFFSYIIEKIEFMFRYSVSFGLNSYYLFLTLIFSEAHFFSFVFFKDTDWVSLTSYSNYFSPIKKSRLLWKCSLKRWLEGSIVSQSDFFVQFL